MLLFYNPPIQVAAASEYTVQPAATSKNSHFDAGIARNVYVGDDAASLGGAP